MEWVKIFESAPEMERALTVNRPRLLLIRGKRICIVRLENAALAVEDTCSHNGESLSKGAVNYLGEIVCPWHGHRFDLITGREAAERSRDLITYPLRELPDGVFIGI